ncbi:hypothetical protein K443DRAFT_109262 [Laccaria amethystina LaAM-08-1]|uniref:Uncharacterized protein n=1 Tax=Laccaria amethystina LaAM-08-1 TaxID=1095629 RepID=A0A0C9X1G6_9AGAR|nr:hypothetical protein K443DRAFT_109262 [Laccaria amethystina LaAM-08-1]
MKTSFLFFIPLIAVIVRATPTLRNDHMESFQASYSLDNCAHQNEITVSCVHCGPLPIKPYCRKCLHTGFFGECLSTQSRTCGYDDALPSDDISCRKGYWGCIADCCKD